MKKIILILICCTFCFWSISSSQDFDKYQMMDNIIKNPNGIGEYCSDTLKINHHFLSKLKDTSNIKFFKNYLIQNFATYSYIGYDTICDVTNNGKLIGYHHYIKYYNEMGNIFCFWFVKKINENWMLRAFGDYEVWDPYPKCKDQK
jgi:hypothetical protein